jgi:serine/threonine-protein kinase HipA
MAPLYDAVTTRVFPKLEDDRMALKLNGKDDRLRRADFLGLASTAGMRIGDAEVAIDRMIEDMKKALDVISLPMLSNYRREGNAITKEMLDICRKRVESFA